MGVKRLNAVDKLTKIVRNGGSVTFDNEREVIVLTFQNGETLETAAKPESKDINDLLSEGLNKLIENL